MEAPQSKKEWIFEARLVNLTSIPSEVVTSETRSKLNKASKAWGLHFPGIGSFTCSAAALLPSAAKTRSFTTKLKEMQEWLDGQDDDELKLQLSPILLDTPGVMHKQFVPLKAPIPMSSVLDLSKETFIDDEVVRMVLELFEDAYGSDGRYMFIPPLQVSLWEAGIGLD
ncbi:hypothetical protein BGZ94_002953 [Podila epigama]|nr:hypothetical protein BGZ94_002953 [Podila epigama]